MKVFLFVPQHPKSILKQFELKSTLVLHSIMKPVQCKENTICSPLDT